MNNEEKYRMEQEKKKPILEVRGLNLSFVQYERGLRRRELHPLNKVSFQAEQGKITAVVGASGAGKSLLAHAILGILPYNSRMTGEIYYKGERLNEERLKRLRGIEISLVPQGVSYLDPLRKVGDQICKGKKDAVTRMRCRKLLARYGLGAETEELYPFELSGGMARRILIAAALMEQPGLVIADEPTPGLDLKTARRVLGHFREMAEEGAAVLLITHDLELALESADELLVFYEGSIVESLSPEAFRQGNGRNEYTRALYEVLYGEEEDRGALCREHFLSV